MIGLNFSHCDAYWTYGLFHVFRRMLAAEIGMDLNQMAGFSGTIPFSDFNDQILPLLDHSDCDGSLSVEECRRVAPRLYELTAHWPEVNFKQEIRSLIGGMERAERENQPLYFC
ncbi:hypothetical protein ACFP7A_06370 [Sporolactobacillus kofuensis]|uniref:Uncharacterized protein n=1 Tax=Sporolactobacillus kofuensis TaxID=269672 RepID=A0ABW1WF28_9BACL|nr:hypothetical protein [Sporolactobacillus kofuensis]MCO7175469.1 hypothetical protein [Sporolactobacillus kofuensis]